MNLKIIPPRKADESVKDYDRERWLMYARRITKNPFVLKTLALRDMGKCAWCGEKILYGAGIHHTTYDHFCSFAGTITVRMQTVQRHARKRIVPDCERCRSDNHARFDACISKLVIVHQLCNIEISNHPPVK